MRILGGRAGQEAAIATKCDAIALRLSEKPDKALTSWELRIDAQTNEGRTRVGTVKTTPASLGRTPNRLVAGACCPGATKWIVTAIGPDDAWPAELSISACPPPLGRVGARPVTRSIYLSSGGVLLASQILSLAPLSVPVVVPASLRSIEGLNATGATRYFQTFDAVGVPANGAVPIVSIPVADGAWFYENFGDDDNGGEFYATGIVWAVSTTPAVLTADAGGLFRVRAQVEV